MKAMLLAAGMGTRLGATKGVLPKVLLPVEGRPILEHNLRYLKAHGVRDVVVNVHRGAGRIRQHLSARRNYGMHIQISHEKKLLGTAGAVKKMQSFFSEGPFLVLYGDNLMDFDIAQLRRRHLRSRAFATVGVYSPRRTISCDIAAGLIRHSRGRIKKIIEKRGNRRVRKGVWVNAGIYVLSCEIFQHIPFGRSYDFSRDVFPRLLRKKVRMMAAEGASYVLASDTRESLKKTRGLAKRCITKRR
jgi:NDP-sugar pyrophosphorylase family protein